LIQQSWAENFDVLGTLLGKQRIAQQAFDSIAGMSQPLDDLAKAFLDSSTFVYHYSLVDL
jgi:hypothetical protein